MTLSSTLESCSGHGGVHDAAGDIRSGKDNADAGLGRQHGYSLGLCFDGGGCVLFRVSSFGEQCRKRVDVVAHSSVARLFLNSNVFSTQNACTVWLTAVPLESVLPEAGLCQDSDAEPNQTGGWGSAQVQEHLADLVLRLQGGGFHKPLEGFHALLPPVWHTHGGCTPSKSLRSQSERKENDGWLQGYRRLNPPYCFERLKGKDSWTCEST